MGLGSSDGESPSRTQIIDTKSTTYSTNTLDLVSSQSKQDIKTATNGVQFVTESKTLQTNSTKSEKLSAKIKKYQSMRFPYSIILGNKEATDQKLSLRLRSGDQLAGLSLEDFKKRLKDESRPEI